MFKRSFSAFVLCSALVLTTSINSSAANWKKLSPVDSPSARVSPMMAYDPVSQKVVLFGGVNTQYLSDTWTFDGVNWTQEHPASSPPARTSGNMAYDRVSRMLVLFGGYAGNGQYLRDTWLWDGATSSWIETNPRFAPTAVTAPLVFTDPKTGHAMTWGGFDGHLYQSTTWLWTGTSWRNLRISNAPFARSCSMYGYDPVLQSVVLFAGLSDGNPTNTWTWDGTSWSLQNPQVQPPYRYCGAGAYDRAMNGVVGFGGGVGGPDLNDTWLWDGTNWQSVLVNHRPPPREGAGMTFDTDLGHIILFGGLQNSKTVLNDTWELLP